MFEFIRGLLLGILQFYVWTVGAGLVVLGAIMLVQGAFDLIRDLRPVHVSRTSLSRRNA